MYYGSWLSGCEYNARKRAIEICCVCVGKSENDSKLPSVSERVLRNVENEQDPMWHIVNQRGGKIHTRPDTTLKSIFLCSTRAHQVSGHLVISSPWAYHTQLDLPLFSSHRRRQETRGDKKEACYSPTENDMSLRDGQTLIRPQCSNDITQPPRCARLPSPLCCFATILRSRSAGGSQSAHCFGLLRLGNEN